MVSSAYLAPATAFSSIRRQVAAAGFRNSLGKTHPEEAMLPLAAVLLGASVGQVDPSARVIWALEKLGWVFDVRWPKLQRFAALRTS